MTREQSPRTTSVIFRQTWGLPHFDFLDRDKVGAAFGPPHDVRVELRCAQPDDLYSGESGKLPLCVAESTWRPSEKMVAALQGLADRQLPEGTRAPDGMRLQLDEDGRLAEGSGLILAAMPDWFQSFSRDVYRELQDYSRRTVRVLRWRRNGRGPHNPFKPRGGKFSFDGKAWHNLPSDITTTGWSYSITQITREEMTAVKTRVAGGGDEPLGHVLLREAREQLSLNRQSALLVGVSALEVGVKECINALVPENQWLLENMASPPVEKLLREYLPRLTARGPGNGKIFPPPKAAMDSIKKAVSLRNKAAHTGADTVSFDDLEPILATIRDVLWLLDFYTGHQWAVNYISEEFRRELFAQARTK